jgi:hypothetical protein
MGTTGKRNPDHFQVCPKAVCDRQDYRRQLKKLRLAREASVVPFLSRKEETLRAGEPSRRLSKVRCARCSAEIVVSPRQVLAPCRSCGATTYSVVGC